MPPPTPSTTRIADLSGDFRYGRRIAHRILVLDETAANLFHGSYRGLLRSTGQERPGAGLPLPGALGADNDDPIGTALRIVRDRVHHILGGNFVHNSS